MLSKSVTKQGTTDMCLISKKAVKNLIEFFNQLWSLFDKDRKIQTCPSRKMRISNKSGGSSKTSQQRKHMFPFMLII